MRVWPYPYLAVKAPRRNNQKSAIHLKMRKSRSTNRTKGFGVLRKRQDENFDLFFSAQPLETCCLRKKICRMGRSSIFSAPAAMAEIELVKVSFYFKPHFTAKARTCHFTLQTELQSCEPSLRPGQGKHKAVRSKTLTQNRLEQKTSLAI